MQEKHKSGCKSRCRAAKVYTLTKLSLIVGYTFLNFALDPPQQLQLIRAHHMATHVSLGTNTRSKWHQMSALHLDKQRNGSHAYKHNFERSGHWQSNRPLVRKNYLKAAESSDTVAARHELEVLVTSQ